MSKINPLINKYNWEGINYPSEKADWKIEKKILTIAFNVLYTKKEKNISCLTLIRREKKIILLMIPNGEGWHYLAVKNIYISGLLRRIISNYVESFYCLNCFYSFKTKNKLDLHKKVCEKKDF